MLRTMLHAIGTIFKSRITLALENLTLRQQLAVLQHNACRSRLKHWHRAFWILVSRSWSDWQQALVHWA